MNNLNDALITVDLQFRLQSWNRAAERIYGWRADEVIGKLVEEVVRTELIMRCNWNAYRLAASNYSEGRLTLIASAARCLMNSKRNRTFAITCTITVPSPASGGVGQEFDPPNSC